MGVPRSCSSSNTLRTPATEIGSMYVRSEKPGSVMMVAGLEFTNTTR